MKRLLLSIFSAAALLFAGAGPLLTPLPAQAQVSVDAGKTGVTRGMHLLCSSAIAASVTGTTNETALATCTIPAGSMGTSGGLLIYSTWSVTSSANNKTPRIRFGGASGTQYLSVILTTSATLGDVRRIRNRGAVNSQVGGFSNSQTGVGSSTGAVSTSSVDTSASVDLVASCQLASSAESCTLENYEVWQLP